MSSRTRVREHLPENTCQRTRAINGEHLPSSACRRLSFVCVLTALSLNFQLGARLIPQQREGLNFAIAAGLNGLVSLIPPPPEVIRAIILDYICAMDPALPSDCGLMGCTPTGPLITLAHNAQGLLCSCGLKESLAKAKRSRCEREE